MNTPSQSVGAQPLCCPLCNGREIRKLFSTRDRIHHLPGIFDIFRCAHCSALFIDPWLTNIQLAKFYPQDYGRFRRPKSVDKKINSKARRYVLENYYGYPSASGGRRHCLKKAVAFVGSFFMAKGTIPFRGSGKVLDVGCGAGSYLYRLKQLGWDAHGVEPTEAGARQAQSLGLDVKQGMLPDAEFTENYFDVIRLDNVLEHLTDPVTILREIRRILKADGIVLITVPNTRSLVFWLFHENWYALDSPRHVINYSPRTLRYLARATGFEIAHTDFSAGPFNLVRSVKYFFEEKGRAWPRWLREIDWQRSKFIRRALKPIFFFIDTLGYGDFMHATLKKKN